MRVMLGILFLFVGIITLFCTNAPKIEGIRDIAIGYLLLTKGE